MDEFFSNLLFADQQTITWWSMCLRTIIVFLTSIIFVRIGGKRIFGKLGSFDIVVSIMLGTIMARVISGNAKFLPTLLACLVLVSLHRFIAMLAFSHKSWSLFVNGDCEKLMTDGIMLRDAMQKHSITEDDLHEAMRTETKTDDFSRVKEAFLERSGRISVILRE